MRHLIWYIRSAFCRHEWEQEEVPYTFYDFDGSTVLERTMKVSLTCKKCGWHRKYKKF